MLFSHPFYGSVLICHIMPPFLRAWKFQAVDTWDLWSSGEAGQLQRFRRSSPEPCRQIDGSMGRWVDGDFCHAPCHEVLAQSLDNGGKSQMCLDGLWGCELVGDTFGNGGVKLGGHLKGWCNNWGLLALHFVSSFEDLVPLLVACELRRNTLWTFSFGAAFVPCARAIWDMLQFIAPARTRYKDGLEIPVTSSEDACDLVRLKAEKHIQTQSWWTQLNLIALEELEDLNFSHLNHLVKRVRSIEIQSFAAFCKITCFSINPSKSWDYKSPLPVKRRLSHPQPTPRWSLDSGSMLSSWTLFGLLGRTLGGSCVIWISGYL